MKKKVKKAKLPRGKASAKRFVTHDELVPMFKDVKDFMWSVVKESEKTIKEDMNDLVRSTAKGTEAAIRRDMDARFAQVDERFDRIEVAITEHTKQIKGHDAKIDEVVDEMHKMEGRLSEKIDGNSAQLSDHETRITAIEHRP